MSYQVLARKYRPHNFEEMVGQEHVLRALINALDQDRLHQAYLFTGTRGVGKTTVARIFAKCLNCETGITSKPCGRCSACMEINEGRSVDLIEVDAASRTRVEDTRDLLDNVQYMPTHGRFKIYLIDEVHMLSNHSFNALLKTLEEPPEHVKFLLATTAPKKLPATVLSRCLQFNLKNMSPEKIVFNLQNILKAEEVPFEEPALWRLARAADGSMRDALSLTDQAISFGNSQVLESDVRSMLGTMEQGEIQHLLEALVEGDAAEMLDQIAALAEFAPDYSLLLSDFQSLLHRIAVVQAVPQSLDNSQGDQEFISAMVERVSPQQLQLFYQIGLIGQRDLPLAPDARSGFEMVMLRMVAFRPEEPGDRAGIQSAGQGKPGTSAPAPRGARGATRAASTPDAPKGKLRASLAARADSAESAEKGGTQASQSAGAAVRQRAGTTRSATVAKDTAPVARDKAPVARDRAPAARDRAPAARDRAPAAKSAAPVGEAAAPGPIDQAPRAKTSPQPANGEEARTLPAMSVDTWIDLQPQLPLQGITATLAANCGLRKMEQHQIWLQLREEHASLWNQAHETRIESALSDHLGSPVTVSIEIGSEEIETPAQKQEQQRQEQQARAVEAIEQDSNVRTLVAEFGGSVAKETITPQR